MRRRPEGSSTSDRRSPATTSIRCAREALSRIVWHFDYDYADGREPGALHARAPRRDRPVARARLRQRGWSCEETATRWRSRTRVRSAARPSTVLQGAARLAYLALDAGSTLEAVRLELQRLLRDAAPSIGQIEEWLEGWLRDRLVLREGSRYLSLATDPTQRVRLPIERIAALLDLSSSGAAMRGRRRRGGAGEVVCCPAESGRVWGGRRASAARSRGAPERAMSERGAASLSLERGIQ